MYCFNRHLLLLLQHLGDPAKHETGESKTVDDSPSYHYVCTTAVGINFTGCNLGLKPWVVLGITYSSSNTDTKDEMYCLYIPWCSLYNPVLTIQWYGIQVRLVHSCIEKLPCDTRSILSMYRRRADAPDEFVVCGECDR
jgi:hypothetical protein